MEERKKVEVVYDKFSAKHILGEISGVIIVVLISIGLILVGLWAMNDAYRIGGAGTEEFYPIEYGLGIFSIVFGIALILFSLVSFLRNMVAESKK